MESNGMLPKYKHPLKDAKDGPPSHSPSAENLVSESTPSLPPASLSTSLDTSAVACVRVRLQGLHVQASWVEVPLHTNWDTLKSTIAQEYKVDMQCLQLCFQDQPVTTEVLQALTAGSTLDLKVIQVLTPARTAETSMTAATAVTPRTDILALGKPASRCGFGTCTAKKAKVIGLCRYCFVDYCSRHRLPETHTCTQLEMCRKSSFDRNAQKLAAEKCVAAKI